MVVRFEHYGVLPMRVKSSILCLVWFCLTMHCNWLPKVVPLSQLGAKQFITTQTPCFDF